MYLKKKEFSKKRIWGGLSWAALAEGVSRGGCQTVAEAVAVAGHLSACLRVLPCVFSVRASLGFFPARQPQGNWTWEVMGGLGTRFAKGWKRKSEYRCYKSTVASL